MLDPDAFFKPLFDAAGVENKTDLECVIINSHYDLHYPLQSVVEKLGPWHTHARQQLVYIQYVVF